MNEKLNPCPFCGCEMNFDRVSSGWNKITGMHGDNCPLDGNDFITWSSTADAPIIQKFNTRADGWISASINPQFSGRFTVYSSYGVRDAFFTEGFVSGDFRWQDCQTGNDEGMENYDGVEFKVYNWMQLPSPPKAVSCGE